MKTFLKEYWLWIVVPFALVVILCAVAWWLMGDEGSSPFVYNVY